MSVVNKLKNIRLRVSLSVCAYLTSGDKTYRHISIKFGMYVHPANASNPRFLHFKDFLFIKKLKKTYKNSII